MTPHTPTAGKNFSTTATLPWPAVTSPQFGYHMEMVLEPTVPRIVVPSLLSSLASETYREFQVHGVRTPFVGREEALAVLQSALQRAVGSSALQQVAITGPEGIGKSRLVRRFAEVMSEDGAGAALRLAEARGHGASTTALVAQMLRSRFDIDAGDGDGDIKRKLEQGLAGSISPKRTPEAVAMLGSLLGLRIPRDMLYRGIPHPAAFRRRALHRFASLVETDGKRAPQVLVFDQLDRLDEDQLTLIGSILNGLRDAPVLAVLISRQRVQSPPLLPDVDGTQTIALRPLTDETAMSMVAGLLGNLKASREHLLPFIEEVGGNPRRLEELLRVMVQEGVLEAERGRLTVHTERFATTQNLPTDPWLAADSRLDHLKAVELEILGAAAVFGPHFWYDGVLSLLWSGPRGQDQKLPGEDRLDRALHKTLLKLMHADHVRYVQPPQIRGAVELVFSNPFERTSLVKRMAHADRVQMQLHAGRWMLCATPLDPRSWYRRAAELLDAGERPWEAATAWLKTAQAALNNFEADEALGAFDKAAARLSQRGAAAMLAVHGGRARAHALLGETAQALEHHNQVFIAARVTSDRPLAAEATLQQGRCLSALAKPEPAARCLERASRAFEEVSDQAGKARTEEAFVQVARDRGGPGSQEKVTWHARRAMSLWRSEKDPVGVVRNSVSAALGLLAQAKLKQAAALTDDALKLCKTTVTASAERVATLNLKGAIELLQDRNANAIAAYRRAIRVNNTDGARAEYARLASNLSLAYLRAGELTIAEDRVREALAVAEEVGDSLGIGYATWRLATVLATRGAVSEAQEKVRQTFALADTTSDRWLHAVSAHAAARLLIEAETHARSDRAQSARQHLATAQQLAIQLDDKPLLMAVFDSLSEYLSTFGGDEQVATDAALQSRRIRALMSEGFVDGQLDTIETPISELDVLLLRAKRAPPQPICWVTL